jgi:phospholipase/lecithinase/hemolysin
MRQTFGGGWLMFGLAVAGCALYRSRLAALPESVTAVPTINRLYVFGDSFSDSGAGYLDGNGPTAVAYLARHLGFVLVPSNAADTTRKSLNFAVSGAATGSGSGERIKDALLGLGMRNQVEDFAARVHAGSVHFQPESTLFFIAGGLNDARLATESTLENLKTEIRMLHGSGGRRFLIALLPISIPGFSDVSKRLNPALAGIPRELAAELPDASIVLSRWGAFFDEILHDPARYGITNTRDACAGRALFNEDPTPCLKPASYFYYHAEHPSTAVHRIVGKKLYEEVLKLPPAPSAGKTKTSN